MTNVVILVAIVVLSAGCLLLRVLPPVLPRISQLQSPSPVESAWRVWLGFVLGGLIVSLLVMGIFGTPGESSLGYARGMFAMHWGTDSWDPMQKALAWLREHPDESVYQAVFFEQKTKFQYPVSALLFIDIPARLVRLDDASTLRAAQVFSRACVLGLGFVFAALLTQSARQSDDKQISTDSAARSQQPWFRIPLYAWVILSLLGVGSVAMFYPLSRSEVLGQIQTFVSLTAALALCAWHRGRQCMAGVLIGICCVIKPHWAVVVLWGLIRRQWGFALSAASTAVLFLAWAFVEYGYESMFDYVSVISYLSHHGESFYPNQSVNGLVNRILFNGNNLFWSGADFPPYHPIVYAMTLASSMLLIGGALLWNRKRQPGPLDLGLIMLTLTVASPIAWEHHFSVMLPIFAAMLPVCLRERPWGGWTLPMFFVGYVLTSQTFTVAANRLAGSHWNFVQSYLFFGALIILALLYSATAPREGPAVTNNGVGTRVPALSEQ